MLEAFADIPRRRSRRAVTSLVVVIVAIAGCGTDTAPRQTTAPAAALRISTVNMAHLRESGWRSYATVASRERRVPHVISAQELWWEKGSRSGETRRFLRVLEDKTGREYRYIHADDTRYDPDDEIYWSGNAIFYDPKRLRPEKVRVWASLWKAGCAKPGGGQVGVRFQDRKTGKNVVVASVHTDPPCVAENAVRHARRLDELGRRRHLTVLAGDFNSRPDLSGQTEDNGREANPDCWYRNLSAAHDTGNDCPEPKRDENRYYDATWVVEGEASNPAPESFCERFTRAAGGSGERDRATSCTDIITRNGGAQPDGRLDKSRIDFVWLSWEGSGGSPLLPTMTTVEARIPRARTDRSDDGRRDDKPRYSDHRAVFVTARYAE